MNKSKRKIKNYGLGCIVQRNSIIFFIHTEGKMPRTKIPIIGRLANEGDSTFIS